MSGNGIEIHPEVLRLHQELDLLIEELAAALAELSDLEYVSGGESRRPRSALEASRTERERLRLQLTELFAQLARIETRPPFSTRREWEDDDWVADRRAELEKQTAAAQAQAQAFETHLAALLSLHGSRPSFGRN